MRRDAGIAKLFEGPEMIDLLSDTVTKPPLGMLEAMHKAAVGDDVYGEDPTVNRFERSCADIFGKDEACFVPSGTMANLLSIMASCPRGTEVLVGDESDIYNYEAGGASVLGGVVYHPIETTVDGRLEPARIAEAIRDPHDPQCAAASMLCLEMPHNRCGGTPLPPEYLAEVGALCRANGIALHLDGARIFNASVALGVAPRDLAREASSLQVCFSKSLSAPVGSAVVGSAGFVAQVRRLRKLVGGGMRQVGYLCAAAEYALDNMVDRLKEDHRRAAVLAEGLARIPGVECLYPRPATNMVFFRLADQRLGLADFLAALERRGVRMGELGHGRIRAALHHHISDDDIAKTLGELPKALDDCRIAGSAPVA